MVLGNLLLWACTGEQITEVTVGSVVVSPPSVSAVAGESVQLSATIHDENGEALAAAVPDWSSENPSIASVDSEGVVQARAAGSVEVWASYREITGRATVRVLPGPEIAVSRDSIAMSAGVGGGPPGPEELQVTNDGNGTLGGLSVRVVDPEDSSPWLSAELDGATAPANVTLTADPESLSGGIHRAELEISSTAPGVATVRVPVTIALLSFSVEESGGESVVSESGRTDSLLVSLDAQPSGDVVLTVSSSDGGEVTGAPARLTFTPETWGEIRAVVLVGQDDDLVDGDRTSTVTVAVDADASDPAFGSVPPRRLEVTTLDDDASGFTVVESGGSTRVSESGTSDDLGVTLTAQPTETVVLAVTIDDTGEAVVSPSSLTFTPESWSTAQSVTVTGVDDPLADGDRTSLVSISVDRAASDPSYAEVPAETVEVTTIDDEVAGFTVTQSGGGTVVSEDGDSDDLTVVLTAQPTTGVVITASSADPAEATLSPTTLAFAPATWNVPQTVTVTGVDDFGNDGTQTTTLTFSVDDARSDDAFDGAPDQSVMATTIDNDEPAGLLITEIDGTTVSEAGSGDAFTVTLTAQPQNDVVLSIETEDPDEVEVDPVMLRFTSTDWDQPRTVAVRGVDDAVDDGDRVTAVTVRVDVSASDPAYAAVEPEAVSVTTIDDDQAGLSVVESGGATSVDESGASDDVTVSLTSQPVSDVVIGVASADPEEATVAPVTLRFTPASWNLPQTVTVTGVDDAFVDGEQTVTVTMTVDPSTLDPLYQPLEPIALAVSVADDDVAGFVVTESGGTTVVTEFGTTDDLTVVLTAQPLSEVAFTVASSDTGEVSVSPTRVVFTPGSWNVPQTVTVTGVDDLFLDGSQIATVTLAVDATASDPAFGQVEAQSVAVTNRDNELIIPTGR